MTAAPIPDFEVSAHAVSQMGRRGLSQDVVRSVLLHPEQRWKAGEGRDVLQARVKEGLGEGALLVRVFVDVNHIPPLVVTAYATSKVDKYWRSTP